MNLTSPFIYFFLLLPASILSLELQNLAVNLPGVSLVNSQLPSNNPNQDNPNQSDTNQQNSNEYWSATSNIIGYDCGKPTQITTVSLYPSDHECDITPEQTTTTKAKIRVLQRSDFQTVDIMQCKVIISRHISHCGEPRIEYSETNSDMTYVYDISRANCTKLHNGGTFEISQNVFVSGVPNKTKINNVFFAGSNNEDNYCSSASFSDSYGSWNSNVTVNGTVTITLKKTRVNVQLSSQKIILPSGQQCDFRAGNCVDSFSGHTFWDTMSDNDCKRLGILMDGKVDKILGQKKTMYKIQLPVVTFALAITKSTRACNTTFFETEHPRLLIWERKEKKKEVKPGKVMNAVENMDLLAYVNAKFLYLDYNTHKTTTSLYYDILGKECQFEKKVLKNTLSLATMYPEEFAMKFKKSRGYIGVLSGEVVHILRCTPVEVTIKKTDRCYNELTVLYNNKLFFLSPVTHILKSYGTQVPCNDALATLFRLNNQWYKLNSRQENQQNNGSVVLELDTKEDWKYGDFQYLVSGGIYSNANSTELRALIMNGPETTAIINELVKRLTGANDFQVNFQNLEDEELRDVNLSYQPWYKIVDILTILGSICAILYGLFIIYQLIKAFILLIVNAFALNTIGGAIQHIFKTISNTVVYFFSDLFASPSVFVEQEQVRQELKMIRKKRKLEDKSKNDSDDNSDSDQNVKLESQALHKQPNKHNQLTNNKDTTIEIQKMKATPFF